MNSRGVEELPEDVHVMINFAVRQTEELCLYILMSRLFMVRFYCAVFLGLVFVCLFVCFFSLKAG